MKSGLILEPSHKVEEQLAGALTQCFPEIGIMTATTLQQCHDYLHEISFDVALLNLNPPGGSSLPLIKRLNQTSTYCIAISDLDDDASLFSALEAGAWGYLLSGQLQQQLDKIFAGLTHTPPLSPAAIQRLVKHFHTPAATDATSLSAREMEVLGLIAQGSKLQEVAKQLGISRHTCAEYVKNIYHKLDISSRAEAALAASRLKLI